MKIRIEFNGKTFIVTYDQEGLLDTVMNVRDMVPLLSSSADVKKIARNADQIRDGEPVRGIVYL